MREACSSGHIRSSLKNNDASATNVLPNCEKFSVVYKAYKYIYCGYILSVLGRLRHMIKQSRYLVIFYSSKKQWQHIITRNNVETKYNKAIYTLTIKLRIKQINNGNSDKRSWFHAYPYGMKMQYLNIQQLNSTYLYRIQCWQISRHNLASGSLRHSRITFISSRFADIKQIL